MLLMRHNRQTKTRKKRQIHGILLVKSKIKPTEKKRFQPKFTHSYIVDDFFSICNATHHSRIFFI